MYSGLIRFEDKFFNLIDKITCVALTISKELQSCAAGRAGS